MARLCGESLCPYLGRSDRQAVVCHSALTSNGPGDLSEISRGRSTSPGQEAWNGKGQTSAKEESHSSRWRRSS